LPIVNSSDTGEELPALAGAIGRAVRGLRVAQSRSLGDLARDSGLSRTILSRIEHGGGNPSIETLWRIARALGVPLGALLGDEQTPRVRAIPARSRKALQADSGMRAWLVHAEGREHRSELFDLDLPAGVEQRTDAHIPGTEELIVCVSGRVLVGPLGEEIELAPGDSVWFAGDRAHRYLALRDTHALCWMLYGPAASRG
jgi:transcriptional regulator with XRE-family HTH domain